MQNGHPVRRWRERRKIKAVAFARQLQIAKSHLSEIESGKARPSLDLALAISDLTNISLRRIAEYRVSA